MIVYMYINGKVGIPLKVEYHYVKRTSILATEKFGKMDSVSNYMSKTNVEINTRNTVYIRNHGQYVQFSPIYADARPWLEMININVIIIYLMPLR